MNIESSNTKKIIIIGALVVVFGFVIYYFFFQSPPAPVTTLDQYGNPVPTQVVGQDLVDLLNQVQSVTLDQSIFSSPEFTNLVDFSTTLPNETPGRPNPFGPLSGVVQNVQGTQ